MYKDDLNSISFLKNKPVNFNAFLCSEFKRMNVKANDMICIEGDPADESYFVIKILIKIS